MAFECPPRRHLKITFSAWKTVLFSVLICSLLAGRFEALIWRSLVSRCAGIMHDPRVGLSDSLTSLFYSKASLTLFQSIMSYSSLQIHYFHMSFASAQESQIYTKNRSYTVSKFHLPTLMVHLLSKF